MYWSTAMGPLRRLGQLVEWSVETMREILTTLRHPTWQDLSKTCHGKTLTYQFVLEIGYTKKKEYIYINIDQNNLRESNKSTQGIWIVILTHLPGAFCHGRKTAGLHNSRWWGKGHMLSRYGNGHHLRPTPVKNIRAYSHINRKQQLETDVHHKNKHVWGICHHKTAGSPNFNENFHTINISWKSDSSPKTTKKNNNTDSIKNRVLWNSSYHKLYPVTTRQFPRFWTSRHMVSQWPTATCVPCQVLHRVSSKMHLVMVLETEGCWTIGTWGRIIILGWPATRTFFPFTGWWLNQPIWNILVKMGSSSPSFGVKIPKHIWNHHLVNLHFKS